VWLTSVSGSSVYTNNVIFAYYFLLRLDSNLTTAVAVRPAKKLPWAQPSCDVEMKTRLFRVNVNYEFIGQSFLSHVLVGHCSNRLYEATATRQFK